MRSPTVRSALNLINIDESGPGVNPRSRTDRNVTFARLERVLGLAVAAALVAAAIAVVRRMVPRFAEFDGQVIRQTFIEHDEDPDEYRVVVDDGARPTAWDLRVAAESWRLLPPGTFVHARVNLHDRQVSIHPVEPPAMARPLADPGVAFDPRGG